MQTNLRNGNTIFTFKNGDKIMRVKPVFSSGKYSSHDYSFSFANEFLGIKNNLIYLRSCIEPRPFVTRLFGPLPPLRKAYLELFWNNWGLVKPAKDDPAASAEESSNGHNLKTGQPFISEGQFIYSFKPGDIIIRVKPAFSHFTESICNDYREPMEFIGIKKNEIYLMRLVNRSWREKGRLAQAELKTYEKNWELFQLPAGVENMNLIQF